MQILSPYVAQHHQALFHGSKAKFKFFMAGVGAGKTLCGMHEFIYAAEDNPQCDGLITSPTYPMFRDIVLPLWREWIPQHLWTYHKGDQSFTWHNTGRRFFVRSSTNPDGASGLNVGYEWHDEHALIHTDRLWKIALARLRQKGPRPRCIVTSTPNGLNWLAKWFRARQLADPANVCVIRCRTRDNKMLPEDYEAGLRAAYGEEYAQQMLDAIIIQLQGLAWPIAPGIHCKLSLDEMRQRCGKRVFGAVDWGHTNPACCLVGGLDSDWRWHLMAEWYRRGQDREVIAARAEKLTKEFGVKAWFIDHDPEGESQMRRKGLVVHLADKNVESGVMHVRSLLSVRKDGEPRLHVNAMLKNWLREQSGYTFPEEKEEPEGANGDHAMDATRYLTFTPTQLHSHIQSQLGLRGIGGSAGKGGFGGMAIPH